MKRRSRIPATRREPPRPKAECELCTAARDRPAAIEIGLLAELLAVETAVRLGETITLTVDDDGSVEAFDFCPRCTFVNVTGHGWVRLAYLDRANRRSTIPLGAIRRQTTETHRIKAEAEKTAERAAEAGVILP